MLNVCPEVDQRVEIESTDDTVLKTEVEVEKDTIGIEVEIDTGIEVVIDTKKINPTLEIGVEIVIGIEVKKGEGIEVMIVTEIETDMTIDRILEEVEAEKDQRTIDVKKSMLNFVFKYLVIIKTTYLNFIYMQ